MNKNTYVSVIVPVRDRAEKIRETIDSILAQDHSNFELIIIDDGSSDKTPEVLKSYGKKIRVITNKKSVGPAAARNRGIRAARGKIIFFTDSDCIVKKNWISIMLREYKNENIAGVGGFLQPVKNNLVAKIELFQNKFILGIGTKKIVGGTKTPMGYTNNASFRRKTLLEVNGFDEKFPQPAGEDIDLKRRICEKGYSVVYIPFPVIHMDTYNWVYLADRIITRGMEKRPPKNKFLKFCYAILTLPISFVRILIKIKKYRKKKLI